ncbi:hypothetical protein KPH14_008123 [Odynerus spinipes]|uniref:Sine oculis-binding protein homolog n=1 Tax=Odynerus spinipes TaxID=1348599 RepID=A0AAD9VPK2_9HYME|nr:hypothetical protein KPH14_008123 [Odynerus spinipes]
MGSRIESHLSITTDERTTKTQKVTLLEDSTVCEEFMGRKSAPAKVKREEEADEEIREYAATAMSELLGWYGYEKVDSGCTRGLNLDHFAPVAGSKHRLPQMDRQFIFNGASSRSPMAANQSVFSHSLRSKLAPSYYPNEIFKNSDKATTTTSLPLKTVPSTSRLLYHNDSTSSSPDEMTDVRHRLISCSWCGRIGETWEPGRTNPLSYGMVNALGQFCSEACFAAGRRAAFKRARTCDWCRHVRNPISYVDFQDGESQLQFCSDKCLNQYKMNIFCRETETHLALHGLTGIPSSDSGKGGLITPELWLRNCQSPRSSTEEVLIVDDESISRLSPLPHDTEIDRKDSIADVAKSESSSVKILRRNSFCTRNDVNSASRAFKRKVDNVEEKLSEDGEIIRETVKESLKDQEYSKYYHYHTGKQHIMEDIMDSELHDRHRVYKSMEQKNEIHVKDVKELRGRESKGRENVRYSQQRKFRKSSSWIPETSSSPIQSEAALSPSSCTEETRQQKYQPGLKMYPETSSFMTMPPVHPVQSQFSSQSPSSSLLPPVTILVPYPIPIPIPVPIPIPLPTTVFEKFLAEKKETSSNNTDSDRKSSTSDDLPDSVISTSDHTRSVKTNSSTTPISEKCRFTAVSPNSESEHSNAAANGNVAVSKSSTRTLRKKKRVSEDSESTDRQSKRRNKFLTT